MQNLLKNLSIPLFAAFFTFGYISCQKEVTGPDVIETPVDDLVQTNASVQGYITNEAGLPLQGATVAAGSSAVTTDINGYFRFNNIQLSKNNGYVKVTKSGYFVGSRSFVTNTGRINEVKIQLIPKTNVGTIDAATGGTVTLPSGVTIALPAAAVVNASTNVVYTGTVKVAAGWIDPSGNTLLRQMPGDLRGITTGGQERGLQTFGMVAVELTGSAGELLQIATGKKATVNFVIPSSIASFAPATIALWYFDETTGRWKEDGLATKNGNMFTAEVSHFSFWNCDAPFPLITFNATIVNSANSPLVHTTVRIKRLVNNSFGYGITDSTGFVCGKIPANESLVLEVLDECNGVIYSQNIGPFSANTSLGSIVASASSVSIVTISGTLVNCSNAAVTNGYVDVHLGTSFHRVWVVNGAYSLTITNCSTNASAIIIGVDNTANQQSAPQTVAITSNTVVVPAIQACGTSSLQTIDYTIDAAIYNLISPPDSIMSNSSGTANGNYISGYSLTVPSKKIAFQFSGNPVVGSYPLSIYQVGGLDSSIVTTPSPMVNITVSGAIGQFIEGNFSVQMKKLSDNSLHAVTCTFRVRR